MIEEMCIAYDKIFSGFEQGMHAGTSRALDDIQRAGARARISCVSKVMFCKYSFDGKRMSLSDSFMSP